MPPAAGARDLYVRLPFCVHRCGYCDFVTVVGHADQHGTYVDALLSELGLEGGVLAGDMETVFLGGGTPTFTHAAELTRLLEALPAAEELTVEGNPETVTAEPAELLYGAGVSRISLGAQSFQPHLLSVLEGRAAPDDVRRAVSLLREAGHPNISLDLVYGIPGQSAHDNQAIRHGQTASRVEATMRESGTKIGIELRTGFRKRAFLNEASLPRPSALLGRMPVVSFSVTDLEIARGEPVHRRRFLDTELAQLFPAYLEHLSVYKRALEHRNALLKTAQEGYVPDDQFTPWEAQMAAHGTAMRRYREQWVSELAVVSTQAHAEISNGESFQLIYEMNDDIDLLDGLERHRASDVRRGATSCGPHRDDLAVLVGGVNRNSGV